MRFSFLSAAILGVLGSTLASSSTFDAASAFSSTNPSGAWTYGTGVTGKSFTPMDMFSANACFGTSGIACWQTSSLSVPAVARNESASTINFLTVVLPTDVLLVHPGPSIDAIVNWTAPSAGTYNISGFFELLDITPTGVITYVYNGSNQLFAQTLTGPPASQVNETVGGRADFSLTETLAAGATLSFGVNNDGDYLDDSTGFDATIRSSATPTPEPSAVVLLTVGLVALWALRPKGYC